MIVALVALLLITHHPVREPKRALIFRLATLHRVSGPGYVFVLPFFEHIEDELHMGLREMQVEVPLGLPGDPLSNLAHLDITWRIHPAVRGRPPSPVHDILLESDELRGKLVRESVARAAGWVLIEYSHDDLTIPAARESIAHTIACTANAELTPCGLLGTHLLARVICSQALLSRSYHEVLWALLAPSPGGEESPRASGAWGLGVRAARAYRPLFIG